MPSAHEPDRGPVALVYRGPAAQPGCAEAVAGLLAASPRNLTVRFVGPAEDLPLSRDTLRGAALYAQPGGGGVRRAYWRLRREAPMIRDYVSSGGRYLGFCLGGYLAGHHPGFGLLPADTDQYIRTPGADVTHPEDAVITVRWGEEPRHVYFQDGPVFAEDGATVLARYRNGLPAALVARYGQGVVGVVGPHPEATTDWFTDVGLAPPDPLPTDLGLDLLEAAMRP